jgi:hypothetical protein
MPNTLPFLVRRPALHIDPYATDPGRWAHSLVHLAELMLPCLDVAGARSVVEVGAYAGDLTQVLVEWAADADARVWAIDPFPQDSLVELDRDNEELELIRETSLNALPQIPRPDVVIIDGDHNFYTVSEELRLIEEGASGAMPLTLVHDVCWPHGRRDDYYTPELIPDDQRQPIATSPGLFPGVPGTRAGGLPYSRAAAQEGGTRNGVLTAVEDFVAERPELRLAIVPVFFGLGVVWPGDAPWSDDLAQLLEPWDRNPLLERLEANRVLHLAVAHVHFTDASNLRERVARQQGVLTRLLESSAFSIAERLSRLRGRLGIAPTQSVVSKDEIRRVLAD